MHSHKLPTDAIRGFVLAGDSIFTAKNTKTGNHFTFRVTRADERAGDREPGTRPFFVKLLTGSDNENDFSFFGCLWPSAVRVLVDADSSIATNARFSHSPKAKISAEADSARVFREIWHRLETGKPLPSTVEIWHEGRCARCARKLTVPESIEIGVGPECAAKLGITLPPRVKPAAAAPAERQSPIVFETATAANARHELVGFFMRKDPEGISFS